MALIRRLFKWLTLGLAGLLILVAAGGWIYQLRAEAQDLARFPAPGRLVEVAGRRMHIHCVGDGSPTVVLEQGLNAMAAGWGEVHEAAGRWTRVCAYDRAGLGYSEPIARPTRADEVADRLAELLEGAGIDDPLVLVGWSAGGVYVRAFQRHHPERVSGMLLIDSSHEQQSRRYPENPEAREGGDSMLRVASYLAPLGLVRWSGMVRQRFESYPGSEESKERLIALYEQSHVVATMLRESEAFNFDIDGDPPTSLGDLPLIVLAEDASGEISESQTPAVADYLRRRREIGLEMQRELASLSTRGRLIVASGSGHAIHFDRPELVVDSIRELVQRVRDESP